MSKGEIILKKLVLFILTFLMILSFNACKGKDVKDSDEMNNEELTQMDFDKIIESASNKDVYFYGWGGDAKINKWLDEYMKPRMKEKYNINFNRVPMNIDVILSKLLNEKALNEDGSVDIVWINGENFYSAKENDLLYGPFLKSLPNAKKYLDFESRDVNYDFGFEIDGYESPFGKAQFVLIGDEAKIKLPKNHEELLELAKNNKGKITYPIANDFVGSAFIRTLASDIISYDELVNLEPDYEIVKEKLKPLTDYLNELEPYLWNEGKTYPYTSTQLENMYQDNEVLLTMNYNPNRVALKIKDNSFTDTSKAFVFDSGTVSNTHFLAIPKNAKNKKGALVFINEILSLEVQASKFDTKNWGDLPALSNSKLSKDDIAVLESIKQGQGTINIEKLQSKQIPELNAKLIPLIEQVWEDEVLNK